MMEGLLGNVLSAFERISALSESACGGCQKELHPQRQRQDAALLHIFSVKPLPDGGPEAARATQRGARLANEGRAEEAIRELHDARQLAPNSPEACNNLGCAYHQHGDDSTALHWYREARRLNPRSETAVLAQAYLEQRRGFTDESQRLLVSFLKEVDSSHVGALRQLGKLHIREEHWSKAAGCFHRLIAVDPMNDEWPAQLQLCLNNLPVKNDFGEPVQNPTGLPGVFALAFSFAEPILRNAMPADAKEALGVGGTGKAFGPASGRSGGPAPRSPSGNEPPSRSRGGYGNCQSIQDGQSAEALLGLADSYADVGNLDAALEVAKQLLASRPDDAEANLRVVELLLGAGHSAEMVEPYLKACNVPNIGRPLKLRALCVAAEAALLREEYAKAHSSASEAVRIDAEAPRALLLLGHTRLRIAEYAAALRAFGAALDALDKGGGTQPRCGEARRLRATAHVLAAEAHERQRQYPQALVEVQQALDLVPQMHAARVVRATALQQSGRTREAERELEGVLHSDPDNAPARLLLGYCLLCSGDPRAVPTLEMLVTSPGSSRSALGAAKVYLGLALESQAERTFDRRGASAQRAECMVQEALSIHKNLQQVWREIEAGPVGQPLEAVQRLRGICDLDLTSAQAKQLLRLMARAMGRPDLAQALAGTPARSQGGASSREGSVQPNRWAPLGSTVRGAHSGTSTPLGLHGASTPLGTSGGHTQWHLHGASPATPQQGTPQQGYRAGSPGYSGYPGGGPDTRAPQQRGRRSSCSSRQLSPDRGTPDSLTIGWNELIRPEQLVFGPQLGAGGSAQVYRGSWNGQEVAIKKISGVAHLEEMRKEINALRRLRHPRLVRFIGACVQPPLLLVVTEFMPGGSLHDRLFGSRRDPPMVYVQRWMVACQMAEGLTFLHTQRVVHRDLKSMNILLDTQQGAKICDFGLAQQMPDMVTHIARKLDGEEGGSPRYMAPECYDAKYGKITEKVDIWAMGCILIELFGGVLPYADCQTMAQLSGRILCERRSPDVPHCVPPIIATVIQHCICFDPQRRVGANELQAEINRLRPPA